jgi:hypothetical protein
VLRLVLFCLFAAILAAAIYSYIAIGHCYPALGIAAVAGAATGLINPLAGRQRTPRMAGIIILVGGFWVSHQFAGVPDKGPHRLAYDAQYLAVFLIATLLARRGLRWR